MKTNALNLRSVGKRYSAWLVGLALILAQPVFAATDTWSGGTDTNWGTGMNWNTPPSNGDSLVFGPNASSSNTLTDNLVNGFSIAGITFNSSAPAYLMTGNSIALGAAGITNSDTQLQRLQDNLALGSAATTFTMTTGGGNITLSGVISDSGGGITTAGAGTLALYSDNTYTGTTTIGSGTALAINSGELGSGGIYTGNIVNSGAFIYSSTMTESLTGAITGSGALTVSNGELFLENASNTYSGGTSVLAGTLVLAGGTNSISTTGAISISATGVLDLGANSQTTSGAFTYTSGATVQDGTLSLSYVTLGGSNNAWTGTLNLGAGGAVVTTQRLLLGEADTGSLTIGAGSTGSITFGGDNNSNENYVGVSGGANATLTVNGGTVNFTNSSLGTGNGYLNVASNNGGTASSGSVVVNGGNINVGTWIKLGGTYTNANVNGTANSTSSLSIANGTVTIGGGSDATSNGVLFMNGGTGDTATYTASSTVTLGAGGVLNVKQIQTGDSGTDTIDFNGGTLTAGASSTTFLAATAPLTVNVQNGGATINTQAFNDTIGAAFVANGTGGLTKTGTGTLILTGVNTYTGATTINSGTFELAGTGTTLNTGSIIVNSGGTLLFGRSDTWGASGITTSAAITINSGGIMASGGFYNTLWNPTLNGGEILLDGGANAKFPAFGLNGTLTVTGAASIVVGSGSFNAINLGNASGSDLTVDVVNAGDTLAENGVLQDNVSVDNGLIMSGAGAMTLSAANTYTGGTTVSSGTLYANNATSSTGTGAVSVGSGATLAGLGTIAPTTTTGVNAVSVATGGVVMPGGVQPTVPYTGTPGAVANGNMTLNPTNVTGTSQLLSVAASSGPTIPSLVFTLGAGGPSSGSQIIAGGSAANVMNFNVGGTSGTSTVVSINDLIGANLTLNQDYDLIQGNGSTTYEANGQVLAIGNGDGLVSADGQILGGLTLLAADTPGNYFADEYGSSQLFLVGDNIEVEVAPEPKTWALLIGGFALLILWQRRKNGSNGNPRE